MRFITVSSADEKLGFPNRSPHSMMKDDPQGHRRQEEEAPEVMLLQALRPVLISMRIACLYVPHEFEAGGFPEARDRPPPQNRCQGGSSFEDMMKMKTENQEKFKHGSSQMGRKLSLVWTALILLVSCASGVRAVTRVLMAPTLDLMLYQGTTGLWSGYAIVLGLFFFKNSWRGKDGWAGFFWAYRKVHGPGGLDDSAVNLSKRTVGIGVAVAWITIIANISFLVFFTFFTPAYDDAPSDAWQPEPPYAVVMKVLNVLLHTFLIAFWALGLSVYFLLMRLVSVDFSAYNERLSTAIAQRPAWTCRNFNSFRKLHYRLSDLVSACDSLFSGLVGSSLVFNMVLICCQLYTMIYLDMPHPLLWFTNGFYIVCGLGTLLSVAAGAAWIKEKANEPFDIIHDLELTKVTPEFALQMDLFTKKNNLIGITACKMLIVDKGTILTVIGTLITYFVILIQFRPPSSSATSCNCAELIANLTLQCFATAVNTSAP